ncbi:AMP-binding protein [Novosphingopyxis sp.]|uniref:AMP-binding protein n=1 Tax=Novosphingopyxis sp. TaxID=2709690 RepID=UPI003B58B78F
MSENIFSTFAKAAARNPERTFLEGLDYAFRYGEMLDYSARVAGALREAGLKPGDRVVVQVEKSPTCVWLYLGCLRAGIVFVPLNTAYTPSEMAYFIEDAEPALIICTAAALNTLQTPIRSWTIEADESGTFAEACAAAIQDETIAQRIDGDVAAILYTSGTTGRSKGAMLTHGNLFSNVTALNEIWRWQDDDVLLHTLPIFHAHGLFVALHCSLFRATTVLFRPKFKAEQVLADLPKATVFMGVPTFYVRLLKLDGFDRDLTRHMRLFISGSAPLNEPVFEAFEARSGQRILERYGMTEALMITSNPYEGERVAGTVGMPLPGVSARIEEAAGDGPGVLEIAGPNIFASYWRNPEKTAEAFTADGWFRTGDIAEIDSDGRIRLIGRSSDLIITGGYNVYPKEIEILIDDVPGVEESAVIGVPHPDFGEAVLAVVVARGEDPELTDAIFQALRPELAAFKLPKHIVIVRELPRNALGKIEKAALRRHNVNAFTVA